MKNEGQFFDVRYLPEPDKYGTVYHVCCTCRRGVTLGRGEGDAEVMFSKMDEYSERYGCYLLTSGIMKTHYHILLGNPEGLVVIRKCIRSINTSISKRITCQGRFDGPIFDKPPGYSVIAEPFDLYKTAIYIHRNGKDDGNTKLGSLEPEFFYGIPRHVDFGGWDYYTGNSREEARGIVAHWDGRSLSERCKPYARGFVKYTSRFWLPK